MVYEKELLARAIEKLNTVNIDNWQYNGRYHAYKTTINGVEATVSAESGNPSHCKLNISNSVKGYEFSRSDLIEKGVQGKVEDLYKILSERWKRKQKEQDGTGKILALEKLLGDE